MMEMKKEVSPEIENANFELLSQNKKYIKLANGEELCYYDFLNQTASETLIFLFLSFFLN